MKPPSPSSQPPSSAPKAPPQSAPDDDARGEEFDMSTLPAPPSQDPQKPPAPQWTRAWIMLAGLLVAYCFYFWIYGLGVRAQKPLPLGPIPSKTTAPTTVSVYVTGAIARPGVYSLSTDSRISDALSIAGGTTPDADPSSLNLAAFVEDGAKILVPQRAALLSAPVVTPTSAAIGITPSDTNVAPTQMVSPIPGSTSAPSVAPSTQTMTKASNVEYLRAHPIDLNLATSEELQQLPGIGPGRAQEILNYRTLNGRFNSVSDLDNVKGIGEKRMETLKDLVMVR